MINLMCYDEDIILFDKEINTNSQFFINLNTCTTEDELSMSAPKEKRALINITYFKEEEILEKEVPGFFFSKKHGYSHYLTVDKEINNFFTLISIPKEVTRVQLKSICWKSKNFNLQGNLEIIENDKLDVSNTYHLNVENDANIELKCSFFIKDHESSETIDVYINNKKFTRLKIYAKQESIHDLKINTLGRTEDFIIEFKSNNNIRFFSKIISRNRLKLNSNKKNSIITEENSFKKYFQINPLFDYTLSFTLPLSEEHIPKALLLDVKLYDNTGKEIETKIKSFSNAPKFPNYKYLDLKEGIQDINISIDTQNATYLSTDIINWSYREKVEINDFILYEQKINLNNLTGLQIKQHMQTIINKDLLRANEIFQKYIATFLESKDPYNYYHISKIINFKMGDINNAIKDLDMLLSLKNDEKLYRQRKSYKGIVQELNINWLPIYTEEKEILGKKSHKCIKILHLIKTAFPYETTGGSIRCQETLLSQKNAGLEPLALTPIGYPGLIKGEYPQSNNVNGVLYKHNNFYALEAKKLSFDERDIIDTFFSAPVVREFQPDIIHAASGIRGMELALRGLALKKQFDIPFLYEVRSFHEHTWGPMGEIAEKADLTKLRMAQENRCMHESDMVITICETMKKAIIGRGISADKVHVIPNAINPDKFIMAAADENLKKSLGLKKTVIGYISNLSKREGHALLIEAFNNLSKTQEDISLLIVGTGPELNNLKQQVTELNIEDKVIITGAIDHDEINSYYLLIDVFVIPRLEDYASDMVTPLKPFEALALKRALLVSDREVLSEIVEEGVTGITFKTGDVSDLEKKIAYLIKNPSLRKKLGENGYTWVLKNRTWKQNANLYKKLYTTLIKKDA